MRKIPQRFASGVGILSVTSSVYDPLGLVSPVVVSSKKLLQDLCQTKLGWNDVIALEEAMRWKTWLENMPKLSQVVVSRHLKPGNFGEILSSQPHHFSDASQVAFGAIACVRFKNADCLILYNFLVAKSLLACVKPMTIPRLELSSAILAVKIDRVLREELEFAIGKSIFWSDSIAVLLYVRNEDKRFHTFLANRLAVIHDGSQPAQWRYRHPITQQI